MKFGKIEIFNKFYEVNTWIIKTDLHKVDQLPLQVGLPQPPENPFFQSKPHYSQYLLSFWELNFTFLKLIVAKINLYED